MGAGLALASAAVPQTPRDNAMRTDLSDTIGDYLGSEHFRLLDGDLKEHAQELLTQLLAAAQRMSAEFPEQADPDLFVGALTEVVPQLRMPPALGRRAPLLLAGFCEYLAAAGRYPAAAEWAEWMPGIEAGYTARFREDGTIRGSTVKKKLADVGRNEPCPCGSGLKFKKCCIQLLG
jgi:hypothetical protein